jgi:hypothetical protein
VNFPRNRLEQLLKASVSSAAGKLEYWVLNANIVAINFAKCIDCLKSINVRLTILQWGRRKLKLKIQISP